MSSPVQERVEKLAKKDDPNEVRMTFGEHIEELRSRLFKSILFLVLAIIVCLVLHDKLVRFILQPHFQAMHKLYPTQPWESFKPMSGSYGGPVLAVMKLSFIVGLFAASPVIGYQMWAFISAGLYKHERKYVVRFAPVSFVLFVIGCAFGYRILVPYCLYGLAKFMDNQFLDPTKITFSEYLNLVMTLTIILGGVFQVPLIMVFLSQVGIVKPSSWNKWRRHAIIVNVLFAAIITPPDVFSMILVAIPLLLLYEIGFVVSWFVTRTPKSPQPAKP